MIKHILTFLFLFLFLFLYTYSQINEDYEEIKKSFDKEKQEILTKISDQLKVSEKIYGESNRSEDLSKMEKVSVDFQENYRDLFLIFSEKLDKLSLETEGEINDYILFLRQEAKNSFRLSISERLTAEKEKDDKISFELLKSAHDKEKEAIDFQSRAFGVINGWITEDFTIPDKNYNLDETYDNTLTDQFISRNFSIQDASLTEKFIFNNVNQKAANSSQDIVYKDNINNSYKTNQYNSSSKGTEYRIQIGTSIIPASESQMNRLNRTDLAVKSYKSDVYYKYTIGSFASFQEAKNFKNAYGLLKTYIAEYKNGKEVKFYMKDFQ